MELSLEPPYICETKCGCKAGLGQCNHLTGLLYTLAHYVKMGFMSVPPTTSKTSLPQSWHVPSRTLGITPRAVSTVSASKLKPPVINAPPQKKQRSVDGLMSNLYCPVGLPLPLHAEGLAESLHMNLATIGSKSQMFRLLGANQKQPVPTVLTHFGDLPLGLVLSYQSHTSLSATNIDDDPPLPFSPKPCSFSTVLNETESCYYIGLAVTHFDAEQLERETREPEQNLLLSVH